MDRWLHNCNMTYIIYGKLSFNVEVFLSLTPNLFCANDTVLALKKFLDAFFLVFLVILLMPGR